jgi:hypothetical protein
MVSTWNYHEVLRNKRPRVQMSTASRVQPDETGVLFKMRAAERAERCINFFAAWLRDSSSTRTEHCMCA